MINQLYRIVEENYDNGSQITRLPNNQEIMNKINEIINAVNKLEQEVSVYRKIREINNIHIGTKRML